MSSTIDLDLAHALAVAGTNDANLRIIEDWLDIDILTRGNRITMRGESSQVARARRAMQELQLMVAKGQQVTTDTTQRVLKLIDQDLASAESSMSSVADTTPIVSYRGRTVLPKTPGQRDYVDAIDKYSIVFGIGPAGTGKTYLAMAKAVQALQSKQVNRIILTRPAVEAGEKLGFLPGTLNDKIDPYLRPLHDALREMVDSEIIPRLMDTGVIEVAPLAYMRGRTLNDSFVILDEAQNTTPSQMKMFLTRLGFRSKMVVTGDLTQVDLPDRQESGLKVAQRVLAGVDGIYINRFDADDVVRNHLVSRIVEAYDRDDYESVEYEA